MLCSGCATAHSPPRCQGRGPSVGCWDGGKETAFSSTFSCLEERGEDQEASFFGHRVRQRRDSRYNCSGPLPQVSERVPHPLPEKPLLFISQPLTEPAQCFAAQPSSQSPCPALQPLPIRKLHLAAHQPGTQLSIPRGSHTVSEQPCPPLVWKTLTPAVSWYLPGRGSCRAAAVSASPQEWAAVIKVLGSSQQRTVSSFSKSQRFLTDRVCKSVSSTDLALGTAATLETIYTSSSCLDPLLHMGCQKGKS